MKKILFLLISLFVSCSAFADWVEFGGSNRAEFFYDPTTIKPAGRYKRVWTLVNAGVSDAKSFKSVTMIDCLNETSFSEYMVFYSEPDGRGSVVHTSTASSPATPIAPGTNMNDLLKLVCKR